MITDRFTMNGYLWKIRFVNPDDPELVDRTNILRVATTNPKDLVINLSNQLRGDFLMTVLVHELGHCALWSFGLLREIHRMTYPEYWIDMEEYFCNFLADYGLKVFKIAYKTIGYDAWKKIPPALEHVLSA